LVEVALSQQRRCPPLIRRAHLRGHAPGASADNSVSARPLYCRVSRAIATNPRDLFLCEGEVTRTRHSDHQHALRMILQSSLQSLRGLHLSHRPPSRTRPSRGATHERSCFLLAPRREPAVGEHGEGLHVARVPHACSASSGEPWLFLFPPRPPGAAGWGRRTSSGECRSCASPPSPAQRR